MNANLNAEHKDEWLDQAAAYALDALDANERADFETHLASCEQCTEVVAGLAETAATLAMAVPQRVPPPELRARVLDSARTVRPITSKRTAPPPPQRAWVGLAAAAGIALSVVSGSLWWSERGARADVERELLAARTQLDSTRTLLAERDATMSALSGPDVRFAALAPPDQDPSLRVFWNPTQSVFVVAAFALPPAPVGRTYQLWSIAEGNAPVSLGTFATDASGQAMLVLPDGSGAPEADRALLCALTIEPAGGSLQPTETPRLVGEWRQAE